MYFIIEFISILVTFLFESTVANLVTIGEYKPGSDKPNPKECGLTKVSFGMGSSLYDCTQWHKDQGAHNLSAREAPWLALIILPISGNNPNGYIGMGTLIAGQYILTTFEPYINLDPLNAQIYLGHQGVSGITPGSKPYLKVDQFQNVSKDLAFYRLRDWVDNSNDFLEINSLCLPQRWYEWEGYDCHFKVTPGCEPYEYGMMAVWDRAGWIERTYWRLFNSRYTLSQNQTEKDTLGHLIEVQQIGSQTICDNNIGAPIFQYYMGRAVLVAVLSNFDKDPSTNCMPIPATKKMWATRVDQSVWDQMRGFSVFDKNP